MPADVVSSGLLLTWLTIQASGVDAPQAGPEPAAGRPVLVVTPAKILAEPREKHPGWRVRFVVGEGLDWAPMPVKWTKSEGGFNGPELTYSLGGRQVGVQFPGRPVVRAPDGFVVRWGSLATVLHFDSDVQELCAGPIEVAMLGHNVEGEETVLRVTGEVTDARWRRRHCKAVG